jgi:hypothetical protein
MLVCVCVVRACDPQSASQRLHIGRLFSQTHTHLHTNWLFCCSQELLGENENDRGTAAALFSQTRVDGVENVQQWTAS